jgi:hypothetical protein
MCEYLQAQLEIYTKLEKRCYEIENTKKDPEAIKVTIPQPALKLPKKK